MEQLTFLLLLFLFSPITCAGTERNKIKGSTSIIPRTSDFMEIVKEGSLFVDKTMFVKQFKNSNDKVTLLTFPRGWGKSLNMNMLKRFFEIEVDQSGNRVSPKTNTNNYKLFTNSKRKLLISEDENIMKLQGEFPVIFLSFKHVSAKSYETVLRSVKYELSEMYKKHLYLLESSKPNSPYKSRLKNYIYKYEDLDFMDIKMAILYLSEMLHDHFNARAYIFIDDYDAPFNNMLMSDSFTPDDLQKTVTLFGDMYDAALKDNEFMEKGLLTGIMRIPLASWLAEPNSIVYYTFLDTFYAQYYGFTKEEIESLFATRRVPNELRLQAAKWYNGYNSFDCRTDIYNPWSIVMFLEEQKIKKYLRNPGHIEFLYKLFKFSDIREKLVLLINYDSVRVWLDDLFVTSEYYLRLNNIIHSEAEHEITGNDVNLFFRFLFVTGYLTLDVENSNDEFCSYCVKIPNEEMRSELGDKLISYINDEYRIGNLPLFQKVTTELHLICNKESRPIVNLKNSLELLFKAFPHFVGIDATHGNETILHSMLLSVSILSVDLAKYGVEVRNNKLAGARDEKQARMDMILIRESDHFIMIIELKYDSSSANALEQALKYGSFFANRTDINTVKYMGINISCNKSVDIETVIKHNKVN